MNRDCKMNRLILITRNILQYLQTMEDFFMKNVVDVLQMLQKLQNCGALAELVYALVLGTSVFGHESSSLLRPTMPCFLKVFYPFTFFNFNSNSEFGFDGTRDVILTCHLGSSAARYEGSSPFRPTRGKYEN